MKRVTRRWHTLLLVALAALGMILVLLRNHPYGPGLHWDSVNYIGTARNLLAGKGWIQFDGLVYDGFAPLYPALLAFSGLLSGLDPLALAGPLNALLFGLTVFTFGHWLRERIKSRWLWLWGCLALACSLSLTAMSATAMSQPAFCLFIALALFAMDRFWRGDQPAALVWAALFTALACLTHYAGIFTFLMTLLLFLLLQLDRRLWERIKHSAVFLLIPACSFGLWMLYNMLRAGEPLGRERFPPQYSLLREALARVADAVFSTLGRWILPDLPLESAFALGAAALFALAIAVAVVFIRAHQQPTGWKIKGSFCLCGGFILVYLPVMGVLLSFTHFDIDGWHSRYWTPLYIPFLFALVFAFDRWLTLRWGRLLAALLFIWLGGMAELNRQAIVMANQGEDEHRYFAAPNVVNNETLGFIRQESGKFFLNYVHYRYSKPPALYLYTEHHRYDDFIYLSRDLAGLYETVAAAGEGDWLIWFLVPENTAHDHPPPYSYGLSELAAMPQLERVARLDDSVIFRIKG